MTKKTKLLIRDAFFSTVLSGLLMLILTLLFFNIRFFNPFHKAFTDFSFLDVFYAEQLDEKVKVNTDIVLVNVGKDRFNVVNLLQRIIQENPKVIGIDVMFVEQKVPEIDSMLSNLLKHEKVVTAFNINNNEVQGNHSFFGQKEQSGYVNFNFDDKSAVIREFTPSYKIDNKSYHSFAVEVSKKYLGSKWDSLNYESKIKKRKTIKYLGNADKFQVLDIDDFEDYENKPFLKNKIVLLGYLGVPTGSDYDIEDKFFTPLNRYFSGKSDADMFGTVIHANIVSMLIYNDFMYDISTNWLLIITFLGMFFSTMFYMKISKKYKISFRTRKRIFQFTISVLLLLLTFWLFKNNIVIRPTIILVGIILAGSYFKYYKNLTRYLKTKTQKKWKTYLK